MSPAARALIDSTAMTGLHKICSFNPDSAGIAIGWSSTKVAILRFASACLTTPYPDGASSSICDLLVETARKCEVDGNAEVALEAKTVLRVCDTVAVPRGVAFQYVTRTTTMSPGDSISSPALEFGKRIDSARLEIKESEKTKLQSDKATSDKSKRNKSPDKTNFGKGKADDKLSRKKAKTLEYEGCAVSQPTPNEKRDPLEAPTSSTAANDTDSARKEEIGSVQIDKDSLARKFAEENGRLMLDEMVSTSEHDGDADEVSPDIVDGGGPDSEDE